MKCTGNLTQVIYWGYNYQITPNAKTLNQQNPNIRPKKFQTPPSLDLNLIMPPNLGETIITLVFPLQIFVSAYSGVPVICGPDIKVVQNYFLIVIGFMKLVNG